MHQGQGEYVDSGNLNCSPYPWSYVSFLARFLWRLFPLARSVDREERLCSNDSDSNPCLRTLRSRLIGQYNGFWIALPRSGPIRALKSAAIGKKGRC